MLTVLTLNISNPSIERASAIVEWLSRRSEELMVLTEATRGDGISLIATSLRNAGYQVAQTVLDARERGLILASKVPFNVVASQRPDPRRLWITIPSRDHTADLNLCGLYAPSSDPSSFVKPESLARKREWLASFLTEAREQSRSSTVLIGDLNVAEPMSPTMPPWLQDFERQVFVELKAAGYIDAYRAHFPGQPAYSWVGRGNQHLLFDYAFVTRDVLAARPAEYLHDVLLERLSDHAALSVPLGFATRNQHETLALESAQNPPTLF